MIKQNTFGEKLINPGSIDFRKRKTYGKRTTNSEKKKKFRRKNRKEFNGKTTMQSL